MPPVNSPFCRLSRCPRLTLTESSYVFEAEDVDLSDKSGPGYSGANAGVGMIVTNTGIAASGNKFV